MDGHYADAVEATLKDLNEKIKTFLLSRATGNSRAIR
jgi:hypothetical protein